MKLKNFSPIRMKALNLLWVFLALIATSAGCQGVSMQGAGPDINLRTITRLPSALIESSGIAVSGSNRIWSHEDSGNSNELYCFDTTGNLLRTLTVSNTENTDWEDITADNDETWFVGDFGNNNNQRTDLAIYIIPDPETIEGNSVSAGIINFSLSDQTAFPPPSSGRNYDIEAMAWYADSLYLFTKDRSNPFTGIVKMYALPDQPGSYTARLSGSFFAGSTTGSGRVTAADINLHTGELMLLTNEKIISFKDYLDNRFFEGTKTEYHFITPPGQNEGLAFVSSYKLYMTEEGSGSTTGYLYEIVLPQPQSAANQVLNPNGLFVYPNPAKEFLGFSRKIEGEAAVYSVAGIFMRTLAVHNGTVNISFLKPGFYFLSVIINRRSFFVPFQKV